MRFIVIVTGAALILSLSSCGKIADKLSRVVSDDENTEYVIKDTDSFGRTEDQSLFALKNESFANIQLGMPTSWLQNKEPGFYSGYTVQQSDLTGETYYTLHTLIPTDGSQRSGQDEIQIIASQQNEVQGFLVPTKYMVYAIINDHAYELPNLTARNLFHSDPPCQGFYAYYMGICVYIDNMTFFFDKNALNRQGAAKVNDDIFDDVTLTEKDFKPSAKPFAVLLGEMTFD